MGIRLPGGHHNGFPFRRNDGRTVCQLCVGNGRNKTVGSYAPNTFGLHDMHGNIIEWCADSFHRDYHLRSPLGGQPGTLAQRRRC